MADGTADGTADDAERRARRARSRRRAEARRQERLDELVELESRCARVAVAAAREAAVRGRGPRAKRRSA